MMADYYRLARALKFNRLRWRGVAVLDPPEIILLWRKRGRSNRTTAIGWKADLPLVSCGTRSKTVGTLFFPSTASIDICIDG